MPNKPIGRDLAYNTLREHGPMSKSDLAELLGPLGKVAANSIATARYEYPGKFFRVVGYDVQRGRAGREIPIYAAAEGPDVPRPNFKTKAAVKARQQRYYANNRAQIIARTKARRSAEKAPVLPNNQWLALLDPADRRAVMASARMTERNQSAQRQP